MKENTITFERLRIVMEIFARLSLFQKSLLDSNRFK